MASNNLHHERDLESNGVMKDNETYHSTVLAASGPISILINIFSQVCKPCTSRSVRIRIDDVRSQFDQRSSSKRHRPEYRHRTGYDPVVSLLI